MHISIYMYSLSSSWWQARRPQIVGFQSRASQTRAFPLRACFPRSPRNPELCYRNAVLLLKQFNVQQQLQFWLRFQIVELWERVS